MQHLVMVALLPAAATCAAGVDEESERRDVGGQRLLQGDGKH